MTDQIHIFAEYQRIHSQDHEYYSQYATFLYLLSVQIIIIINLFTVVSRKRVHCDLSAHYPVCHDFLLRSKTYLKERPPSAKLQIGLPMV